MMEYRDGVKDIKSEETNEVYDDEDIILPNSPLNNYVKGLNFGEENHALCSESDDQDHTVHNDENIHSTNTSKENFLGHFSINFLKTIKSAFGFYSSLFFSQVVNLERFFIQNFLEKEISMSLLIDEDRTYIENLKSEHESNTNLLSMIVRAFSQIALWLFAVFILVFNCLNLRCNEILYYVITILSFTIIFSQVCIFVHLALFILFWYRLNTVIHNMNFIFSKIKKCIRLIQEVELIARGFASASVFSLAEKIESSPNLPFTTTTRQYIGLRKHTYTWIKELFMIYKASSKAIIDEMLSDNEMGFTGNCLANLDIKEFGILLSYDINLENEYLELANVTNNFSISSLKALYEIMQLQVSEFFKCMYLTTYNELKYNNMLEFISSNNHQKTITGLNKKIISHLEEIDKKYKYYRCFEVVNQNQHTAKSKPKKSPSNIAISVHNMCLRLKSALWRIIEIEDKLKDRTDMECKTTQFALEILSLLSSVQNEISGYEEYWLQCHYLLNELLDEKHSSLNPKVVKIDNTENGVSSLIVTKKCDLLTVVQDEVFEDVISKNDIENNKLTLTDKFFHQDEYQQNFKLLKELKNVLVPKAEEHNAREKAALAKKIQSSKNCNCGADSKESKEETELNLEEIKAINCNCNSDSKAFNNKFNLKLESSKQGSDSQKSNPDKLISSSDEENNKLSKSFSKTYNEMSYISDEEMSDSLSEESAIQSQNKYRDCVIDSNKKQISERLDLLLAQKCSDSTALNKHSFAASIAFAAAQKQQILGLSEEYVCGSEDDFE